MYECHACKKLDQKAQNWGFHNTLNALGQFGTTLIQKFPDKNPDTKNSWNQHHKKVDTNTKLWKKIGTQLDNFWIFYELNKMTKIIEV